MKQLKFVVSLFTTENDYQQSQASAAQEVAQRLGVDVEIIYAENDAIAQSQQLLQIIQSRSGKPDGILCMPVGTGLAQVARAAVSVDIGWVLLNREEDYLSSLRDSSPVPVFSVGFNQEKVGRIQGQQIAALLPEGGMVLAIQGPGTSYAAQQRSAGVQSTKPANIELRTIRGRWTRESGAEAVQSWLRLSTSRKAPIRMVASQNDSMAIGARSALEQEIGNSTERDWWSKLLFIGCDGCQRTGRAWVQDGLLSSTIVLPITAGLALEMLVQHYKKGSPIPAQTVLEPESFPALGKLGLR